MWKLWEDARGAWLWRLSWRDECTDEVQLGLCCRRWRGAGDAARARGD
jgi:hypothetical protein